MSDVTDVVSTMRSQSSMDYWWPKIEPLDVPTPETVRVKLTDTINIERFEKPIAEPDAVRTAIREVDGPPVFLRSDQSSNKHEMSRSSKLIDVDDETIRQHQAYLVNHHLVAGLMGIDYDALYVREWLDLWHQFKSFADSATPIAAEVRVFVLDGEIYDHIFYWPERAIWDHSTTEEDWQALLSATKRHALEQSRLDRALTHAKTVGGHFDGYWSVDFALTEDDTWYLIDMARGEMSEHLGVKPALPDPRTVPSYYE